MSKGRSSHFMPHVGGVVPLAAGLSKEGINPKRKILELVRDAYNFSSVADFGCGKAGWLSVAREMGVRDLHGYDLPEIDIEDRAITEDEFTAVDLAAPLELGRDFSLSISTEVAEHVPVAGLEHYFDTLTSAAPVVLFSAALPYQGGMGHVNENWVEYWHRFFVARRYHCVDLFRDTLWHESSIPYYYRQNLFLYVSSKLMKQLEERGLQECVNPKSLIHPDMYLKHIHRNSALSLDERHSLQADVEGFYGAAGAVETKRQSVSQAYGSDSFCRAEVKDGAAKPLLDLLKRLRKR